ncbi:MAG: glutathione S-transferase family protein [Pseudomonadota bacterium]
MHKLYHFPLSPYSRKVRLVLAEKKIEVELIEERYWEARPEFLRLNPACKVPVLRTDKITLAESNAIIEYIEETHPEPPLIPQGVERRAEVRRLNAFFDDTFYREVTLNLLGERVNKKIMSRGYPDSKNVKTGAQRMKYHLDLMEQLLERRRWLAGDRMSLADFAAAAQISCLDYISDVPWDRAEGVRDWYAKIKSRPAFRGLLADQLPGLPQPPHYSDLDF